MSLTNIGDQKTPGRPTEITFAAETGLPSALQEVVLIGHMKESGAGSGTADVYEVVEIENSGDKDAASGECLEKFGDCELTKMVVAAIAANAGASTYPQLKACPLPDAVTDFGPSDEALTAIKRVKAEFVVMPYDANTETSLRTKLKEAMETMSGPQRVENNQFGSMGVGFSRSAASASALVSPDTQYLSLAYLKDTGSPTESIGVMAAAYAAKLASRISPFNNLDRVTLSGITAPDSKSDWPTVGAGLESESILDKGWTPLYVKPNEEVAIVRSVTTRITSNGVTEVTAYYDVQDFQVLYFFRKAIWTRFSQPDFSNVKASKATAVSAKGEVIRLAQLFEDQTMFQNVGRMAPLFKVERSLSDRHRFDIFVPVNVVPGLHVMATNIQAGTLYDAFTI